MKAKIVLIGILVVFLAVVLVQNTQIVTYRFLFWTVSVSQMILAPLVAAAGFLLGVLVATLRRRKKPGAP